MNELDTAIAKYPWSIKSISINGTSYSVYEFVKLCILYETNSKLSKYLQCTDRLIGKRVKLFTEITPSSGKLNNKFLNLLNFRCCSDCRVPKTYRYFYPDNSKPLNITYVCKECLSKKKKEYTHSDVGRSRIKEYNKLYASTEVGKAKIRASNSRYRARKLRAMPKWAILTKIEDMYKNCPEGYHVDHIVPLQSEIVCGLHVEYNL